MRDCTQDVRDAVASSGGLMRVADPDEVAEVIAYLCEERAHLISCNVLTLR